MNTPTIIFIIVFSIIFSVLIFSQYKSRYNLQLQNYIDLENRFKTSITNINGYSMGKREFYISIPPKLNKKKKYPIVLLFHGGGSKAYTNQENKSVGILNYTELYKTDCICIAFQGQTSNNVHSWISAFPWMKSNPLDDVKFVETVVENVLQSNFAKEYIDKNSIYATGKSDGGEFCLYLYNNSSKIKLKGIAMVSAAHFTLNNVNNTEMVLSDTNKIEKGFDKINTLAIHGTKDQVMPFNGQHFLNEKALKKSLDDSNGSYWKTIDNSISYNAKDSNLNQSNTYTLNIENFWEQTSKNMTKNGNTINFGENNLSQMTQYMNDSEKTKSVIIKVHDQNHCWSGHAKSGPDSDKESNKQFDATSIICSFFGIDLSDSYSNKFSKNLKL